MRVFNTARYLGEAVESILSQTFADFELIAVDDGSTDRSPTLLAEFAARDPRVVVITQPNAGLVAAGNTGLAHCRGEFIVWMDSDDIAHPERIARQVEHLRGDPDCVAVGSAYELIDADGEPITTFRPETSHERLDADHLAGRSGVLPNPTVAMRRRAVEAVGGYRPEFETAEDLDLFLRLAEAGRIANLPDVLMKYRKHPGSVTATKFARMQRTITAAVADAFRRRGLAGDPPVIDEPPPGPVEQLRTWAWVSLSSRNVRTARKYAWRTLRSAPLSAQSWKLMYCALRGR
jgi:glycosyltransferase involved in cell wall biosynthesis